MTNPYSDLDDYQFWRRSISSIEHHLVDPAINPRFRISKLDKISTAGSCFAQHISRTLKSIGFNYYVAEEGGRLSAEDRKTNNYGVFSARYGNVYTTAQLLQLFEEAFEDRAVSDVAWLRPDGRWVDAYRQQVEPAGHETAAAVLEARVSHLDAVRSVFLDSDVFVFTLGLTESWRSKVDGSVFPLAPGVVSGSFDPSRHEFVNFEIEDVILDLSKFLTKLKSKNRGIRVALTVSPVPLIATFEKRSVLTATVYSKSVLRVAADWMLKLFDWVDYFPSYEIITGSFSGGLYYEADSRNVNSLGVAHAMRCFLRNYV
jgi:GSCFA family